MATDYHDAVSWGAFVRQLLLELHCPATDKNMVALLAWLAAENTPAHYNPLATTRPWPRSTRFNSADVRNYPNLRAGIGATLATIRLTPYAPIRAALKAGDSVQRVTHAIEASPWSGTNYAPDGLPWRAVNDNPGHFGSKPVGM
jgi:hypothetical protein